MTVEIEVHSDPAVACSAMIVEAVREGGNVVLTGGSTPRSAYALAASEHIDWSQTTLWFGDERCVQPDDERSNHGMVKATLLDRIDSARAPAVKRIQGELGFDAAAAQYEQELRAASVASFDLLLLGIGPDGHTASLFPKAPALEERERGVVGVPEAGLEPFVPRVTMTLPRLGRARRIVFLAAGAAKAAAVAAAFGRDARPSPGVPASLIAGGAGPLTVLLDESAAEQL